MTIISNHPLVATLMNYRKMVFILLVLNYVHGRSHSGTDTCHTHNFKNMTHDGPTSRPTFHSLTALNSQLDSHRWPTTALPEPRVHNDVWKIDTNLVIFARNYWQHFVKKMDRHIKGFLFFSDIHFPLRVSLKLHLVNLSSTSGSFTKSPLLMI